MDENIGEKLVSAVVLKPNGILDKMELLAFLHPLLKQNQLPKDVFFFDALPKNSSGKTQISAVEKLISSANENPVENIDSNNQHIIKASASEAFGITADRITMEDTAQTIDGWDSMAHLIFITSLENASIYDLLHQR